MKRLVMVFAVVLVLSAGSAWAQDVPKAEAFIGGSVLNIDTSGFKLTPFGWQGSVAGNVNKVFGIVGDFSGHYRNSMKAHSFLGGVQLTHRLEKTSVFAQVKAGGIHFSDPGGSDTNLQLGFGGGVDWNANDKIAIRVIQIDWLPVHDSSGWTKGVTRAGIGIVFKGAAK